MVRDELGLELLGGIIRVTDVCSLREVVRTHVPHVGPVLAKEYGCREFAVTDPDGHLLVLGQCE